MYDQYMQKSAGKRSRRRGKGLFHSLKCAIQRRSSFLIKTCASTFRPCSAFRGLSFERANSAPFENRFARIDLDGRARRAASQDEKTQQEIVLPVEHVRTSLELGIVLRIGPSSCRAILPVDPVSTSSTVYPWLDTPPSIRCFQLELLVAERNDDGMPGFRRRTTWNSI